MPNGRNNAYRGETVRLYARFFRDGVLADPYKLGTVFIHSGLTYPAMSGLNNIVKTNPSVGSYYIEWDIPLTQRVGYYYDTWSGIQLTPIHSPENQTFTFPVIYGRNEEIPIPESTSLLSGLCRVYEFFASPDGIPLADVIGRGSIVNLPYNDGSYIYVNFEEAVEKITDDNGRIDWYFPKNSIVHVQVRAASVSVTKVVPTANLIRLRDMDDA